MSHYALLVTKTNRNDIDDQLAPFDESRTVPAYDRDCWCIGSTAYREAKETAEAELNFNIDDTRKTYWALPEDERTTERWKELTREVEQLTDRYEKEHPLYQKPTPGCPECNGSGAYKSQYNPVSKWDWYQVGGRWMGGLPLKPLATGELGQSGAFDNEPKNGGCDIARVKDVDWDKATATFAVLHDGTWHERGSMGWWGAVSGEKDESDWDSEWRSLIDSLDPEDEVTLVDCHI